MCNNEQQLKINPHIASSDRKIDRILEIYVLGNRR